jgi:dTDP-4-amino-4,6-dideoxygalactose transaminase
VIRCQLPAYSPLSPGKLVGAALSATRPAASRERLADLLAGRFGADQVVLTASGTHALQTALALAGSTAPWAGRPVALPGYTCYDVATAAVGADASVYFYDIDPASLSPDADSVLRALEEGAGVLVANSLYGFPLDWRWLRHACEAAGTLLVEDSAQGLGSGWEGREGGSFGDLTVMSFGRGKGWTGGGGGALLLRRRFLEAAGPNAPSGALPAPRAFGGARAFGVSMAQWVLGRPSLFRIPSSLPMLALGETHYKEPSPPTAMGAFAAAAAAAHAKAARAEIGARRAGAAALLRVLTTRDLTGSVDLPRPLESGECGWLRLPMMTADSGMRDALVSSGHRLGFAGGYPRTLAELPAMAGRFRPVEPASLAGARALSTRLLTLPTHSFVSERDRALMLSYLSGAA